MLHVPIDTVCLQCAAAAAALRLASAVQTVPAVAVPRVY